jgi:hypothetical protein
MFSARASRQPSVAGGDPTGLDAASILASSRGSLSPRPGDVAGRLPKGMPERIRLAVRCVRRERALSEPRGRAGRWQPPAIRPRPRPRSGTRTATGQVR